MDPDKAQAKMAADAYGIAKRRASHEEKLGGPDVDTVDIATPAFPHAPMATQGSGSSARRRYTRTT